MSTNSQIDDRSAVEAAGPPAVFLADGIAAGATGLENVQRALLNILEDFSAEKVRLEDTQRAGTNILEDFAAEKAHMEATQQAALNILEDFSAEKVQLEDTQRAVLNILEDFDVAKDEVELTNRQLTKEVEERKRAEEEIQRVNAALVDANKEIEAFNYSVAHDLRAPLRRTDGFAQLLLEEYGAGLPEEAQHYLRRMREGTHQMGQLVDDLLNLARIGRKDVSLQVTGLSSLVNEALVELKRETDGRAIAWKISPLPFVECDPALMKVVFTNLLSNAVKYTRPRQRAIVEIGTTEHDGRATIFVRDNGVGFSMKYADKLFGVFQRLHRVEDFEGTGVGLATVQRIVHKHGGQIWAEAELDKGASFYFTLGTQPQIEPETRSGSGKESDAAERGGNSFS